MKDFISVDEFKGNVGFMFHDIKRSNQVIIKVIFQIPKKQIKMKICITKN